uniref:Uncharacterized protein n=1 Tax=Romanomermis culicivorax TaxID=13658 RepID=A0A915J2J3_ROMCU
MLVNAAKYVINKIQNKLKKCSDWTNKKIIFTIIEGLSFKSTTLQSQHVATCPQSFIKVLTPVRYDLYFTYHNLGRALEKLCLKLSK